jgi:hypothetical protein
MGAGKIHPHARTKFLIAFFFQPRGALGFIASNPVSKI